MAEMFEGKVAIVTGAASGIGRATAQAFAKHGASVVVSDVDPDDGEETVRMITDAGGEAAFVRTDVSQWSEVEALISATVDQYGRLDYAFNNAGISGGVGMPTADYSEEMWDRVIDINLKGVWMGMKAEIPHMLQNGGAIVNCASILGYVGFREAPAYVASKHGVVGLTKTAALEYARQGIRVNAICPGFIHTPMVDRAFEGADDAIRQLEQQVPVGRLGTPDEIAEAVVWLCSDSASYVTGHALLADGGWVAQ